MPLFSTAIGQGIGFAANLPGCFGLVDRVIGIDAR
jgi:hypothetical protein